MNVSLEKQEHIEEFIPCLCQVSPNTLFIKGAIAITNEEFLIYSDVEPTKIDGEVYYYSPFATISFENVVSLVKSEIKRNVDLKKYVRLDIFCKSIGECKILYFDKKSKTKSKLKKLIKLAKKYRKIKLAKHSVDYGLGSC